MKLPLLLLLTLWTALPIFAQDRERVPIPADSKSPFDFRGKPDWDYEPYQALFDCKTYGELREALSKFRGAFSRDRVRLETKQARLAYFRAKQAYIRTNLYLFRHMEAEEWLLELHPRNRVTKEEAEKLVLAEADLQRIKTAAKMQEKLLKEIDPKMRPYPKGGPRDYHELLLPSFVLIRNMQQ